MRYELDIPWTQDVPYCLKIISVLPTAIGEGSVLFPSQNNPSWQEEMLWSSQVCVGRWQEGVSSGRAAPARLSRMGQREVAGAGCSAQPRPGAGGPGKVAPRGHILGLSPPHSRSWALCSPFPFLCIKRKSLWCSFDGLEHHLGSNIASLSDNGEGK